MHLSMDRDCHSQQTRVTLSSAIGATEQVSIAVTGCPVVGEVQKVGKSRNFFQKVGKK